jgi:hypothetical protein
LKAAAFWRTESLMNDFYRRLFDASNIVGSLDVLDLPMSKAEFHHGKDLRQRPHSRLK